jgi:preprotein translocase subunit SecE
VTQTTERARRSAAAARRSRRSPAARLTLFYKQVVGELRKVIWPTRTELVTYTVVAVFFVSAMIAIVALYDYLFGKAVFAVFG